MKINEMFLSIQGEGIQSGLPTFFIRTTGCNLRCSYCDTKYAYSQGREMNIDKILNQIQNQPFKIVCLTGGEPLLQKDAKVLIRELVKNGYFVDIETNGSIDLRNFPKSKQILYSMDIKCPSSGFANKMLLDNLRYLTKNDQVKFIVVDIKDYNFAKKIIIEKKLINETNVIITPVGGVNCQWIVTKILKDGLNVRIGLQIHKVIFGPKKRGV